MFPLTLLPLPGELVPLHIFEPRYKQLLLDAETSDTNFGIFFNHEINKEKIGSLMRLESVLKRHHGGEADIIVKCTDIFSMDKLYRSFKDKLYPAGDVRYWKVNQDHIPGQELYELFLQYLALRNITTHYSVFNIFQVGHELSLDLHDRYKFLALPDRSRETFLLTRLKFQIHILLQEDKTKDVFHLN
jgi:Lon protease-like protein